jgi:hypothetical protein
LTLGMLCPAGQRCTAFFPSVFGDACIEGRCVASRASGICGISRYSRLEKCCTALPAPPAGAEGGASRGRVSERRAHVSVAQPPWSGAKPRRAKKRGCQERCIVFEAGRRCPEISAEGTALSQPRRERRRTWRRAGAAGKAINARFPPATSRGASALLTRTPTVDREQDVCFRSGVRVGSSPRAGPRRSQTAVPTELVSVACCLTATAAVSRPPAVPTRARLGGALPDGHRDGPARRPSPPELVSVARCLTDGYKRAVLAGGLPPSQAQVGSDRRDARCGSRQAGSHQAKLRRGATDGTRRAVAGRPAPTEASSRGERLTGRAVR